MIVGRETLPVQAGPTAANLCEPNARWPAERFYWSVLETPGPVRAGVLPEGLRPELEQDVPASAGPLHAVCVPAGRNTAVVCACPAATLATLAPEMLCLAPAGLPACVDARIDPDTFNLLVGAHEPGPVSRARLRRHRLAAATVLACSLLAAYGLLRRADRSTELTAQADRARAALLERATPGGTGADERALAAELARLRGRAALASKLRPAPDAALATAELLAAWPTEVPATPQSLAVTGTGASLSVLVEGDPARFLRGLMLPRGWSVQEPRLTTVGGAGAATRLTLELRRGHEETTP